MDPGVYDHIQEEALKRGEASASASGTTTPSARAQEPGNLTTDIQETYKSFAASPWGTKLGGLWGSVNKQAQSYIQEAQKEASAAGQSAFKGFNDLKTSLEGRARTLSVTSPGSDEADDVAAKKDSGSEETEKGGNAQDAKKKGPEASPTTAEDAASPAFIERFRSEAARRLADLQRAEDAADEALLKFGTNISNFLRDAVSVTAPTLEAGSGSGAHKEGDVLFESKDAEGKRVIHTTRFDAQMHVIHCSLDSFTRDPASAEYASWATGFNIEKRTEQISADLAQYEELRRAMEKLVPDKVDYASFWRRYYFLRMVIESEEKRRREMLKTAASKSSNTSDADLAWDEESSDEDGDDGGPSTPQPRSSTDTGAATTSTKATAATPQAKNYLKEPLNGNGNGNNGNKTDDEIKSTAGSESSYDLVSGATSAAPGSPQEKKEREKEREAAISSTSTSTSNKPKATTNTTAKAPSSASNVATPATASKNTNNSTTTAPAAKKTTTKKQDSDDEEEDWE